ncbi:MAG TPA: NUDIX domain-containing protein [Chlamydiales bacterium]|nr:NUDIX domain-containing protein [Chlamydiales bacterium]
MKYEESFGVIPLRKKHDEWEVFIIQHSKGHYWGFPKGHSEDDETPIEAAYRELKEETNLDPIGALRTDPFVEQYQFTLRGERISKRVSYFLTEVTGDVILQNAEISNGIWLPIEEAIEKVTHSEGKSILSQVVNILNKL